MNEFVKTLIQEHLGSFMDKSRSSLALTDERYLKDKKDADELEDRYNALNLEEKDRIVINDYIACVLSRENAMADISYMAGAADTIKLLHSLGAIKDLKE